MRFIFHTELRSTPSPPNLYLKISTIQSRIKQYLLLLLKVLYLQKLWTTSKQHYLEPTLTLEGEVLTD